MIRSTTSHVELSPAVAKALLAFSCHDSSRTSMWGVGVTDSALCATDGHASVKFNNSAVGGDFNGKLWARDYVEQQVRVASATKCNVVHLFLDNTRSVSFPDVNSCIPDAPFIYPSSAMTRHPQLSASYLGLLEIVAKACTQTKDGPKHKPKIPTCMLRNLGGVIDPVVFTIGDNSGFYEHFATVVLMQST